ncbi:hypothetical protein LZ30DRAFT_743986 [Colletotrichum cereale]|nr:hypothetical protein LZ30DRAFT_743986 [Colletotrichum cereale]
MPSQQNRGPELLGVQIAFLVAAWIATLLRVYVKVVITKKHTLDDGVMYLSTVSLPPQTVTEQLSNREPGPVLRVRSRRRSRHRQGRHRPAHLRAGLGKYSDSS